MKKANLFILLLLISPLCSSAQTKDLNYIKVSDYILRNYHPDSAALAKTCRRGLIFIKFKINEKGKISDLEFSKDSTIFIITALTKAVDSLQNDVALINTLKMSGRTIIQPFIYIYQAGCNFPRITLSATPEESAKFYGEYLRITGDMDHIDDAVFDILNFNDKRLQAIDGILLSPIRVSSGSME